MEKQTPTGPVAPYVSFRTLQSGVQALRSHGLPAQIDRSVWASKSGADQTALLGAFRFLGLVDSKGKTQALLRKLVDAQEATAEEKDVLGDVLRQSYADLFELNLETLTPAQFAEAIGKYGPQGSTRDRAIRFFVKAAAHCGIKMSGRLTARKPRGGGSTPNGGKTQRKGGSQRGRTSAPPPPTDPQGTVAMKTIALPQASGSLSLSGTFNPFELVGAERDLVYSIIDLMKEFEAASGRAASEQAS